MESSEGNVQDKTDKKETKVGFKKPDTIRLKKKNADSIVTKIVNGVNVGHVSLRAGKTDEKENLVSTSII